MFKDKTPQKLAEFTTKLLHFTKLCGLLHFLHQPSNTFTQIYLPYMSHFCFPPISPLELDEWYCARFFVKICEKKNYLELLWKLWKSEGIEFTLICIYTQHTGSCFIRKAWRRSKSNFTKKPTKWENGQKQVIWLRTS